MEAATRIVVDWGTSNFRAFRFGTDGAIAAEHRAAAGILSVADGAFEAVLAREIGGWITPASEIFLSGMITSRNGWVETPYVDTPATLAALAAGAVTRRLPGGAALRFLPGICQRAPLPDVMRGEEIQIFGTIAPGEDATILLPGTHSKWVRVEAGRIAGFRTFLTGELFALLKAHSIIGRLIPAATSGGDPAAFLAGIRQARDGASAGLLNDIFTARSGALLGAFAPADIAERLSGIIIGHEIAAGLALGWRAGPLRLVGEPALCARYQLALACLGEGSALGPEHAAVEGFRRLARLEGLAQLEGQSG